MRASRPEIACSIVVAMLCGDAMRVSAQVSDSVARMRVAQMSVCPEVLRRDHGPLEGKELSITPFFLTQRASQIGFGLSVGTPLNGSLGSVAVMSAMSIGEGSARFSANDKLEITIDDSTHLAPTTSYTDRSPREGIHFESIGARLGIDDVQRFAGAKRIHVQLGSESYDFNRGQVQAFSALAREVQHPTGAAKIATGCVGPSPDEVMAQWSDGGRNATMSGVDRAKAPVYFEFQVEKPASSTGSGHPIYPAVLRGAKVEGTVLAQFVVLEDGSVDMDTFKVLRSSEELFSESAKEFVQRTRFLPAEIGGRKVRQLVQLPFEFRLNAGRGTRTDTSAAGPILLRRDGSSEVISIPRNSSRWTTVEISPSDSAHLPADVFLPSQVDVPARSPQGSVIPAELPPQLAEVFSGYAVLEFVANADGSIDGSTFKVLRASSREVAAIYARAPAGLHVLPAERQGKKVRQLVVMAMPVMMRPPQ